LLRSDGDLGKTIEKYRSGMGIKLPVAKQQYPQKVTHLTSWAIVTNRLKKLQKAKLYTRKERERLRVFLGPLHKTYVPITRFIIKATIRLNILKFIFSIVLN
jgi:hypothetical protein